MDNKFNMTESEKDRIRGLHSINEQAPGTSRVISESYSMEKIGSVITSCVSSNVGMAGIAKPITRSFFYSHISLIVDIYCYTVKLL